MTAHLFEHLRALGRCTHPEERLVRITGLIRCSDCGACKRGLEREWSRPALVEELLAESTVQTLCTINDEQFGRVLAGTEAIADRMHTTENAATFAWAAQQAGISKG